MRKLKAGLLAAAPAVLAVLLTGCGQVDDSLLASPADYSVNINLPYSTSTPLPEYLDVPEQVVIDANGNVTLNDASLLNSTYTRTQEDESIYSTLNLGDTNSDVMSLQQRLQDLGYLSNGVSGVFDAETQAAVKRFEQTYGVMQTGIATPSFQAKLYAADAPAYGSEAYDAAVVAQYTTLQRGAVGSSVYALQQRLKELGYPIRDLTGVYDEETEAAVALFSEAYGLSGQTIAYIALQKELYADTAITYEQSLAATGRTSATTLSLGNIGTAVMRMQTRLIELGYMEGTASGIFEEETEQAVRMFQAACGREQTGQIDATLQNILFADNAPMLGQTIEADGNLYTQLSEGDQSDEVMALQERLIELGYATGSANGIYGAETTNALMVFQHYNGLQETGMASSSVQAYLYSSKALSYSDVMAGATPVPATPEPTATPHVTMAPLVDEESGLRVLTLNSEGSDVKKLQRRLNKLNYKCPTSGVYDADTAAAMMLFQSAIGAPQTGEASVQMQKYIYSKAAPAKKYKLFKSTQDFRLLREGDSGDEVTRLQKQLWELGYMKTSELEDSGGMYDAATTTAVRRAQRAMGYSDSDGIAGIEFQCFIFSKYNYFIKK